MKKILVIGGSGFLGSHVADAFTESGYQVVIFDKQKSQWIKKNQIFVNGDIMDPDNLVNTLKDVHGVYHFAGISDIEQANNNSLEAVKQNILGTTNILEACVEAKVLRFVFASSVYVYSDQGGFYRSTKQACELLIENYNKLKNLNFTILRFGSLYGRRANRLNFIYDMIHQALTEGKMERYGDGEEMRDYIHVTDAAKSCVSILDDEYKNTYLMLTGDKTIKVRDLLNTIQQILDTKVTIHYLKDRAEEHYNITPYSFRPRTARKFNQKTQTDLGEGILDTIYEVYKNIYGQEKDKVIKK